LFCPFRIYLKFFPPRSRTEHNVTDTTPAFFWSFWPGQTPVDAETMNWGVVMFAGVGFLCAIAYALQGRKIYSGPVKTVMGREHEL
jgi:hypothetical protein